MCKGKFETPDLITGEVEFAPSVGERPSKTRHVQSDPRERVARASGLAWGIGASYLYALAGTAVTAATNSNSTATVPRGKGRSAKSEAAAFPSAFTLCLSAQSAIRFIRVIRGSEKF